MAAIIDGGNATSVATTFIDGGSASSPVTSVLDLNNTYIDGVSIGVVLSAPAGSVVLGSNPNAILVGISSSLALIAPAGVLTTTQTVALVGGVAGLALSVPAGIGTTQANSTVTYTPSTAVISNPSRGFFQYTESHYRADNSGFTPLSSTSLAAARTGSTTLATGTFSGMTIVFRYFYMEKYKVNGSTIDATYLTLVDADLAAIKASGCRARIRFAYDDTYQATGPWTSDVNQSTVQAHIQQLAPTINKYADVVDAIDAGFVGTFGEWFYTSNFLTGTAPDTLAATDVTARNAVIGQLLTSLDSRIFVNMRYPAERQNYLQSSASNPGGQAVRIGHHNDAFLADDGNYGTYVTHQSLLTGQTIPQLRSYIDGIASVPIQGESANYNPPGSDWAPSGTVTQTDTFTAADGTTPSTANFSTSVTTGSSVAILANQLRLITGTAGGYGDSARITSTAVASADAHLTVDLTPGTTTESYLDIMLRAVGRDGSIGSAGYKFEIGSGGYAQIQKVASYSGTTLGTGFNVAGFAVGTPVHVDVQVSGFTLTLYAWTGATKPSTPNITVTDTTITAAGNVGLYLNGGNAAASSTWDIDNWSLTTAGGTPPTYGGAAVELDAHNFSNLNPNYFAQTLQAWGQTNIDIAQKSLGYRLRLVSSTISDSVAVGANVSVSLTLRNDGYAPPYRNRPVQVVFVNGSTVVTQALSGVDVRTWQAGADITVTGTVPAPSSAGTWQMHLVLPDPTTTLTDPAYAVQLANTNAWDNTTGRNSLLRSISVTTSNVALSGVPSSLALTAPAGMVSVTASVSISSVPTSFVYAAFAGAVNAIRNVALPGAVSALTVVAPSGITSTVTNVSLSGVTQGVVFAVPSGVVGTSSFSTNAAPTGASTSLNFLTLSGVVTNSTNSALPGSLATLILVAPAGGAIPAVQINGSSASVTLSSPAGTVAMAVNATPLGTPAVVNFAAPTGGVNVTSPVNLSGATAALALLSAVGGVAGTSVVAGVVSTLSLTPPVGSVSGTTVLTGQTVALSLNTPSGNVTAPSATGSVSLTGAPTLFALAASAGSSSLSVTLAGALSTLSTSVPAGGVTVSSAATNTSQTAASSPLTVLSTPGLVNPVSVVGNAALSGPSAALALGTPAGSFIQTVVIPGSTATLTLTSPAGVAAMNVNPVGVTTGISYNALSGVLLLRTNATPLGTNTFVTMTAPPGLVTISVATIDINLSGVTTALTLAAPAGGVLPSVVVNGTSNAVTLLAPAGVVSLSVVIPGSTAVLLHATPAGVVSPVSTATNVTLSGTSASLVLSAPAGVASAATNVLLAGSAASLITLTPVGAPALVSNAAPLGVPAAMTLFAPAGTVSNAVVMYGAPASLAFTGSPGTAAMSVNILGTTASFILQAVSGLVPEHSYIVMGTTALMKAYSPSGGVSLFIGVPQQMKGAARTAGRWTPRVPPARTRST